MNCEICNKEITNKTCFIVRRLEPILQIPTDVFDMHSTSTSITTVGTTDFESGLLFTSRCGFRWVRLSFVAGASNVDTQLSVFAHIKEPNHFRGQFL